MKLNSQQIRFIKYFGDSIEKVGDKYFTRLHENDQIEFKRSFVASNNAMNKAYLKTIAGFANHKGGWMIFGVEPNENEVIGIKSKYANLDNALVSMTIRDGIDGTFTYDFYTGKIFNKIIGFLKIDKASNPPVIVKQFFNENGISFQAGDIYFRYSAQTTKISASDLRNILDDEITKKTKKFLSKVQQIIKIGSDNTALLNTSTGEISSDRNNVKLILSEDILDKVNLIEEGKLVKKDGAPAYIVKGNIETIIQSPEIVEKTVTTGIRSADYYSCFFNFRCSNPRVFIKELLYRESQYYPIYFFMQKAKMNVNETIEFIKSISEPEVKNKIKNDIIERLKNGNIYTPIGALIDAVEEVNLKIDNNIEEQIKNIANKYGLKGNKNKTIFRTIIVNMLINESPLPVEIIKFGQVEIVQAFSHMTNGYIKKNRNYLLNELQNVYTNISDKNAASFFRKILCRYDFVLFGKLGS